MSASASTELPSPWRGEGPGMGVGDFPLQKPVSFERGRLAQRSGYGATPIPDPSPLQGEGNANWRSA